MVIIASFYFCYTTLSVTLFTNMSSSCTECAKNFGYFFVILQEEGNKDIVEETVLSYIKLCGEYTG